MARVRTGVRGRNKRINEACKGRHMAENGQFRGVQCAHVLHRRRRGVDVVVHVHGNECDVVS